MDVSTAGGSVIVPAKAGSTFLLLPHPIIKNDDKNNKKILFLNN